jgi:deazaflavin-dependent oxidoreductase (nitroreductase family)
MSETEPHDNFNDKIIDEHRANGGNVGGWFEGQTLLLLHHNGAKTGTERVNPLVYQKVGDSYAVFASKGGAPQDPQWYRNLLANPDTTIEVGGENLPIRARLARPEERARIYAKQKADMANFAEYEVSAAPREIPVIILDPVK